MHKAITLYHLLCFFVFVFLVIIVNLNVDLLKLMRLNKEGLGLGGRGGGGCAVLHMLTEQVGCLDSVYFAAERRHKQRQGCLYATYTDNLSIQRPFSLAFHMSLPLCSTTATNTSSTSTPRASFRTMSMWPSVRRRCT